MGAPRRLKKRGGVWYYVRRVPTNVRHLDRRERAEIPLKTSDEGEAELRKSRAETLLEDYWKALLQGSEEDAKERYEAALTLAELEGFSYRPSGEIAAGPLTDLVSRLERLEGRQKSEPVVNALLGGEKQPPLDLDVALERFDKLTKHKRRHYSKDQLRRWLNPRKKAVRNFNQVHPGKDIREISREDALDFIEWWEERINAEDLTANSANKDIGHLNQIITTVSDKLRLGLPPPFTGLRFSEDKTTRRGSFEAPWIRDIILKPDALSGLDTEERLGILLMVETGLRPVEFLNLGRTTIRLDNKIPFVSIEPDGRVLKTPYSKRQMPLVGVSLDAIRETPAGFPTYRDRSSAFSDRVNRFMREAGMFPTDRHTLYSLRHGFQDRLTDAEVGDQLETALMGHKLKRPYYGRGPTLEHKHRKLIEIGVTTQLP